MRRLPHSAGVVDTTRAVCSYYYILYFYYIRYPMKKLALILFLIVPFCCQSQVITTYAGDGIGGILFGDGGSATSAEVTAPAGLSFDDTGNLLICQAKLVRKVNKLTNIIYTIAGSDTATGASCGGSGGDGCNAYNAFILSPMAVCVDSADNYYIADHWYSEIRKVTIATNIIDTFAGDRGTGGTGNGGPAKNAGLNDPISICFDPAQHYLYISNEFGYAVRKVNMLTDTISAFAGTGVNGYSGDGDLAINAKFSRVLGICSDSAGNIYVGDWDNARIRKVDAITGIVTTIAGNGVVGYSGDGGLATSARINRPAGLCFDKCANLYFSMEDSNCVRRIDANTGIITTIAGNGIAGFSGDSGLAVNAKLYAPIGVIIDSSGNLFIGDNGNNRVRKVTIFNPYIHISATPNDTICVDSSVTIQATLAGGGPTPSFQWFVNGTAVSGVTSGTYTYTPANGDSISCILTSSSPCVGNPVAVSNAIHIVIDSSCASEHLSNVITQQTTVYPSPANDLLNINNLKTSASYRLLNIIGATIQQGTLQAGNNSISITSLSPGMYLLELNSSGPTIITKFIKQ